MTHQYLLYGSPDSANLVIRMLLHELGAQFESVWLNRAKQEHKKADYLALNPQGLMPVLVDQGQPIFETAAIVLHLCDQHELLAPQSGVGRSRFLQWLFFLSNTAHADLRARFYSDKYIEGEANQAALRSGVARRFEGHLQIIEAELATNNTGCWFLGENLSALDIYFAALCRWWQLYPSAQPGAAINADHLPRITQLLSELSARPAIAEACAEESISVPFFISPKAPELPADMITG